VTRPEDARTEEFATDGKTEELPKGSPADSKTVNFEGHRPESETVALPANGKTAALPVGGVQPPVQNSTAKAPRSGFWRELCGALTAGVVILAAVVLVLEVLSWTRGLPGLGVVVLVGHLVGAVLAILLQRQLDRRSGRPARLAGLGLGAVVVAMLVLFWWT
jgi:hypothetical protein